ncbi:MAG: hypothetical protein JKX84_04980 [Flavobacteriales bacterium]|nr:hypothetical protein [Flavobacteriales bacterium]
MKALLIICLFPTLLFGQNVVKVHIDHGALHCPHLAPKFHDRFSARAEIDSVSINSNTSIGTLYMADGMNISDDQITDIIVNQVGYPVQEIKAIIRDED